MVGIQTSTLWRQSWMLHIGIKRSSTRAMIKSRPGFPPLLEVVDEGMNGEKIDYVVRTKRAWQRQRQRH